MFFRVLTRVCTRHYLLGFLTSDGGFFCSNSENVLLLYRDSRCWHWRHIYKTSLNIDWSYSLQDNLLKKTKSDIYFSHIFNGSPCRVVCATTKVNKHHTHAEFYNHNNKNKIFISLLPENIISHSKELIHLQIGSSGGLWKL